MAEAAAATWDDVTDELAARLPRLRDGDAVAIEVGKRFVQVKQFGQNLSAIASGVDAELSEHVRVGAGQSRDPGRAPTSAASGCASRSRRPPLSRRRDAAAVELTLTPTDVIETEEYRSGTYDPGWRPEHRWTTDPDTDAPEHRTLGAMMAFPHPPAADLAELGEDLRELLGSLTADLPLLHPYAEQRVPARPAPVVGAVAGRLRDHRRPGAGARGQQHRARPGRGAPAGVR
jgi:hypothetical protein